MSEKNIFIFTAADRKAQANFNKTIEHGVDVKNVIQFIDDKEMRESIEISSSESEGICYVWGSRATDRNVNTWRRMRGGDLVLGYWGFSIRSASCLIETINSKALAIYLWGDKTRPFELIYFVKKPVICNYPIKNNTHIFGEKYQGFTRINDASTEYLFRTYGSFDYFIKHELQDHRI